MSTVKQHKNIHGQWTACHASKRACRYSDHRNTTNTVESKPTTPGLTEKIAELRKFGVKTQLSDLPHRAYIKACMELLPKDGEVRYGINAVGNPVLEELNNRKPVFEDPNASRNAQSAFSQYSFVAYKDINTYLRTDSEDLEKTVYNSDRKYYDWFPEEKRTRLLKEAVETFRKRNLKDIKAMDEYFAQQKPLDNPQVVYRYHRLKGASPEAIDQKIAEEYQVGKQITFSNYMSTSIDSDAMLAAAHRDKKEMIVFEIVTKQPGAVLHAKKKGSGVSMQDTERELLLPRGLNFTVVGVKEEMYKTTYSNKWDAPNKMPNFLGVVRAPQRHKFKVIQLVENPESKPASPIE